MNFDQILKIVQFFNDNKDIDTSNLKMIFELNNYDYEILDKNLYVRTNGTMKNYKKNSTIELHLGNIYFIFQELSN